MIGADTRSKHKYVRWELEAALEKKCRIIAVNIDKSRQMVDATCPLFVPFAPKIIAYALKNYQMKEKGNFYYKDEIYKKLGY